MNQQILLKKTPSYNKFDANYLRTLKESVDITDLLLSLGFNLSYDKVNEIRSACAIHGGDNKSAFRFNKQKRTWVCFSHKCHEVYGNDIIGLIKAALRVDFLEAVDYLKSIAGDVSSINPKVIERKFELDKNSFIKKYTKPNKPSIVSEEHLKIYKPLRSKVFNKCCGFTDDVLDAFEVAGGYTDDFGVLRDIIPIRDVNKELVAYSLHDTRINPPNTDYKYILTEGFIKDKHLYNLHDAKIFGTDFPLIVVEGFKSVWRLYSYGIYNVVCAMGSFLTSGQIDLLKVYAHKGIVVFFDCDKAGEEGADLAKKHSTSKGLPCCVVKILLEDVNKESDGPAELTLEQVYRYLNGFIR